MFDVRLRIAMNLSAWELFVEWQKVWHCERWEYLGQDGNWHRFWRRNGSVPRGAL